MEERSEREIRMIAQNRKARHDYHVVDSLEAGVALVGTEVKALREGKCSFQDAHAVFKGKDERTELFLTGLYIPEFKHGNINNHAPKRDRKLLLKKREILRLLQRSQEKGYTIIPLAVYFSGPYCKVEIGLCKGKKLYDKRDSIKEKDMQRRMRQAQD